MNNLLNTRCYLAGAIEKKRDNGFSWRNKVKADLTGMGIFWLDPCDKPIKYAQETPLTFRELKINRVKKEVEIIKDRMKIIRAVDRRLVNISDFLIVDFYPDTPTTGTHEEVCWASEQNKPVIIRIEGGLQKAPLWWYDELNPNLFFGEWKEVYGYLYAIARTDREVLAKSSDNSWLFFNWMGDQVK